MSGENWTPGPWGRKNINGKEYVYGVAIVIGGDGDDLKHDNILRKSNANLIAAAPELYAELKEAYDDIKESAAECGDDFYKDHRIEAVLAKARGEQE